MGRAGAQGKVATKKQAEPKGKGTSSAPTGSGATRTARQQAMAAKKSQEQEKRVGKSVAPPDPEESEEEEDEESDEESDEEQVPTKKTKLSKGKEKEVSGDRDREKTPTQRELYDHLINGVSWTPTRFADMGILKELGIDGDVQELLAHMKLTKLLTMAFPTYKEATCQFLSSLQVQFHDKYHAREGWGRIAFVFNKKNYRMSFKDIGSVMGFPGLEHSLPKVDDLMRPIWKLLTGRFLRTGSAKNSHIRSPPARYLHRMIVHAFYPRKQHGTCNEEDLRLMAQAIIPYVTPEDFEIADYNLYDSFGMVGFFVTRLQHYRDYAWTTYDKSPVIGIGGMITPLFEHLGIRLTEKPLGPTFIDVSYLESTTYLSGKYQRGYVYYYVAEDEKKEVALPHRALTSLDVPESISFDVDPVCFFRDHCLLKKINEPKRKRPDPRYKAPKYKVPGSS